MSQQNRLVDSVRDELNTAREAKNEMEQFYNNKLIEIERIKKECDEVKKFYEVVYFLSCSLNV